MKFYCVQTKGYVEVADSKCTKQKYPRSSGDGFRYAFRAVDSKGHKLTLFTNEKTWTESKIKEA